MTKRYSVEFCEKNSPVYDNEKQRYLSCFELDDLLHNLQKENEQLKQRIDKRNTTTKQTDRFTQICQETEQLLSELKEQK